MGVVDRDVKVLAEKAGSSQSAKMRYLEELLAIQDHLKTEIEGGFCYGFQTIDLVSAGWDEFCRIEGYIKESDTHHSRLLATSSRALKLLVARCESQLVYPVLETGSENNAPQQPQQQQGQFKTEVVVACRDEVELDTKGEEQE